MASRRNRTVKVYEVLYVEAEGPAGVAGDGSHVARFRSKSDAEQFAKGRTLWSGAPAKVDCVEAPLRLAERWGCA